MTNMMTNMNHPKTSSIDHPSHSPNGGDSVILVIDNVSEVRKTLERSLRNDYKLLFASTGNEALERFNKQSTALVLIDVNLPDVPSWDVCRSLLGQARVPIVFLAESYRKDEAIRALGLGAVDYISKTVSPQVLLARTRAALRRKDAILPDVSAPVYEDGYLYIDLAAQEVFVAEKPVQLTTTEYNLLIYLLKRANKVCSKDQILNQIWGAGYETSLHYVHLYIGRLRRKLEKVSSDPQYLISVYGKGYYFQTDAVSS